MVELEGVALAASDVVGASVDGTTGTIGAFGVDGPEDDVTDESGDDEGGGGPDAGSPAPSMLPSVVGVASSGVSSSPKIWITDPPPDTTCRSSLDTSPSVVSVVSVVSAIVADATAALESPVSSPTVATRTAPPTTATAVAAAAQAAT